MSPRFLLDENMSQVVATQVRYHRPELSIESVHIWRGGAFEGRADKALLQAAFAESLTLVTYGQKTIPPLLAELYAKGESHFGIVFVDYYTIPSNDFGALTRALISLWEQFGSEDWRDCIRFLEVPT